MRGWIDIDHTHSRAISQEIGERLREYLKEEPELPASLRKQIDRLRELDGYSPSIVPTMEDTSRDKPPTDVNREDRSRFDWLWRRRG